MLFQKRLLKDICKRCAKCLFIFLNMEGNRNIQSSFTGGSGGGCTLLALVKRGFTPREGTYRDMLETKLELEGMCLGLKVEKPCWSWGLISQSTYSVQFYKIKKSAF